MTSQERHELALRTTLASNDGHEAAAYVFFGVSRIELDPWVKAGFLGARDFFRKDALCANRFKGGGLGIKMLILCRDTRVADDHFASLPKNLQQQIGF